MTEWDEGNDDLPGYDKSPAGLRIFRRLLLEGQGAVGVSNDYRRLGRRCRLLLGRIPGTGATRQSEEDNRKF